MFKKLIYILIIQLIFHISNQQEIITDEFSSNTFNNEAIIGWQIKNQKGFVSVCNNTSLFGGHKAFGKGATIEKTYFSKYDFYSLQISFDLYLIRTWDAEAFMLSLNNQMIFSHTTKHQQAPKPNETPINCANNVDAKKVSVNLKVQSNLSQKFTLRMTSSLDQDPDDESWGIRGLKIIAKQVKGNKQVLSKEFLSCSNDQNFNGWSISKNVTNPYTKCGGNKIFGGYNLFGKHTYISKEFKNITEHYALQIEATLWFVDSPDDIDYLFVKVDNDGYKMKKNWNFSIPQCGSNSWQENTQRVSLFYPHSLPNAKISIYDEFDQNLNDESWGIQDLVIYTLSIDKTQNNVILKEFFEQQFDQAPGWYLANTQTPVSSKISKCGNVSLLGGFLQLSKEDIEKKYDLPFHNKVIISFDLYALDTWDNEAFNIYIDDEITYPYFPPVLSPQNLCGVEGINDNIRHYLIEMVHIGSTLKIRFESELDENPDNESYGIRQLQITSSSNNFDKSFIINENTKDAFFKGWEIVPAVVSQTMMCGYKQLFGGYNIFGQGTSVTKTYNDLPQHNFVRIYLKVNLIDTWDQESLLIYADDTLLGQTKKGDPFKGSAQLCGRADSKEETKTLEFVFQHDKNSLKLKIQDQLNQEKTDESWGIEELVLVFYNEKVEDQQEYQTIKTCFYQQQNQQGGGGGSNNNTPIPLIVMGVVFPTIIIVIIACILYKRYQRKQVQIKMEKPQQKEQQQPQDQQQQQLQQQVLQQSPQDQQIRLASKSVEKELQLNNKDVVIDQVSQKDYQSAKAFNNNDNQTEKTISIKEVYIDQQKIKK